MIARMGEIEGVWAKELLVPRPPWFAISLFLADPFHETGRQGVLLGDQG